MVLRPKEGHVGLMYVALVLLLEDLQALKMGLNPAAVVLVLLLADLGGAPCLV